MKHFFYTASITIILFFTGSTFSKLFGGEEQKPVEEKPDEKKPTEETPYEGAADKNKDEKQSEDAKESLKKPNNETASKNGTEKEDPKEKKPKIVIVKEPIQASEEILTINLMNKKQFTESSEKLRKLESIEKEINRRATALNNLESFVIDIQNKLDEEEYAEAGTSDEIEKIRTTCQEISDWLYEDGSDADADTYEKKLDSLHSLTKGVFSRVWEHKERPEALNALHSMLNHSTQFLGSAKNLTKAANPEKDVFTDVEIDTLEKVIHETTEWQEKAVVEQDKLKKHEPPKLTVKILMDKMGALDREVKYLINKLKMWRPKKIEKPVQEKSENDSTTEKNETSDKENDEEAIVNEETIEIPESGNDSTIDPSTPEQAEDTHTEL